MAPSDRSVVVVGASAAGLRCACRLARLRPGWQVGVVEAAPVFSYAACGLPYALSGEIPNPDALRQTGYKAIRDARFFAEEKGVTVLAGWRAAEVRLAEGLLKVESAEGERKLRWDELVLATGARPIGVGIRTAGAAQEDIGAAVVGAQGHGAFDQVA